MITIACCLWDPNENSWWPSRYFDEDWVHRLYCGWKRNLTAPFRFVCFADHYRPALSDAIHQLPLLSITEHEAHYGCLIEPYRLNEPMILTGLDTVVVGNCDHYVDYCLANKQVALLRHPRPELHDKSINGVQFIPAGHRHIYDEWRDDGAKANDMEWLRRFEWTKIDDVWPGQVLQFRWVIENSMPKDARIVFGHGTSKPNFYPDVPWVREHWRVS